MISLRRSSASVVLICKNASSKISCGDLLDTTAGEVPAIPFPMGKTNSRNEAKR